MIKRGVTESELDGSGYAEVCWAYPGGGGASEGGGGARTGGRRVGSGRRLQGRRAGGCGGASRGAQAGLACGSGAVSTRGGGAQE
eukprot:6515834-Prymnesium_polylepis.1